MGITLQGAGALAGGTVQGFQTQRADNRAQAAENRTAEQYGLEKTFRDIFAKRNDVDQPDPPPQQGAVPTGPPGATQGALPVDPNAQGPNTLGTMEVTGAPATRSRRDKYNEWKKLAEDAAVRAGGLEGLSSFNKMETEISRQQVMGYGLEAIRALNGGSVGEAAKIANTALEASPNDTGLEFFAMNGELYMQGADGDPSGPLNADALRVFVEDHMKSPETYLAWQKQYEDERANKAAEEDRDTQIGINDRAVTVQEEALPSQNLARSAGAYRDIKDADTRAVTALTSREEENGYSPSEKLKIMNDLMTMQNDGKLGLDPEWDTALGGNGEVAKLAVSNMTDIVTYNEGVTNYADAAGIVRAALGPNLGVSSSVQSLPTMAQDGQYYVMFNGKKFAIPENIYQAIQAQKGGEGQ
jgi:hypothetical protein